MSTINNHPMLRFDFPNQDKQPLIFTQPIHVISTTKLDKVSSCLLEAEQAMNEGYYVAGYVSYEATYALNQSLGMEYITPSMPIVWFGVFQEPTAIGSVSFEDNHYRISNWQLNETIHSYEHAYDSIMEIMHQQDVEQINYTTSFQAKFSGDGYAYYEQLKQNQKASYSAFLHIDDYQILSISPELFFQLDERMITVKPMKGTIHRGKTYEEDLQLKQWLQSSEKNRFENKMITNLMKEELLSIVEKSSIQVIDPFKVEQYPTVYQMTSTIQGKLLEQLSVIDVFRALFPCGSISGVPKQKALEVIAQVEKQPRGVYCGAIGYMTPNQQAIFNVPIRTLFIDQTKKLATFGVGGAITKKSHVHEEYAEVLTKAKILEVPFEPFQLLETIGLYDGEFVVFEEHMERLENSATYFNFQIDISSIQKELLSIKNKYNVGNWRIRLVVEEDGQFTIETSKLTKTSNQVVKLAKTPIHSNDIFLYHKTTHRKVYEKHLQVADDVFDVLLWNENEEITEFTIGNIVVELDGELYTPPVECGLLSGTFRARLLNEGIIKERKVTVQDIERCSKIYLINSVRKWVPVELKKRI